MRSFRIYAGGILLVAMVGAWIVQSRDTKGRLIRLEKQIAELSGAPTPQESTSRATRPDAGAAMERITTRQRLTELENTVSQLSRVADYLMERGQVALSTNKVDDLHRRLLDGTATDAERLNALRLLRRNHGLTDELVQGALAWLQTSQDKHTRREILQQLDGATNSMVRQPLLNLATGDADPKIREEAIENLRHHVADAEVEKRLWELMQNDPSPDVRKRAEEALRKGDVTPERQARLQQRATDSQAAVDERLTAWRALRGSGGDITEATASLVQLAQNAQDPATRAKVFRAFDGERDPSVIVPLVNGLQDPDPGVRRHAADALSGFASDPNIQQWLQHVATSDPDAKVRREAAQTIKRLQDHR